MKNITLSADEDLIRKARGVAHQRDTSLNELFRDWLRELTRSERSARHFDRLMERLDARESGGKFSREEMNER